MLKGFYKKMSRREGADNMSLVNLHALKSPQPVVGDIGG